MDGNLHTGEAPTRLIDQYISRMPSLSVTVSRVLEICNSSTTSPHDLNRVIALDPVLTGQVLRLINSAYYGLRNKVTSLPRAIIMLGMNTIKNLVLSTAVLNKLVDQSSFRALSMEQFWLHCLCTGVAAKWLATVKGVPIEYQEEYFVGGLLHDLGKIPLNNLFSPQYGQIVASVAGNHGQLYEKEQDVLGIDHTQVGGMIAQKWKLGDVIDDCLRYHHETYRAREQNISKVRIISLANMCAKCFGIGCAGDSMPDEESLNQLSAVNGITEIDLDDLQETLSEEIEKAQIFLHLNTGDREP